MRHAGRSGSHRSKKKRITLALAPVAALVVAVPLMTNAGAATPDEVAADCAADSEKLENCEFVDVQFRRNNLGPNERVSGISDNCETSGGGGSGDLTKSFSVTATVNRIVVLETGVVVSGSTLIGNSVFEVGFAYNSQEFDVKRDENGTSFSFNRSDKVKADHIAFFMWSAKRTKVSGYLKATYKEEQDGQKVFFFPSEGATSVHVFYPQILKNGTPFGRLWLRNVKCGTPEADGLLNSGNSSRAEPGFNEAGGNVTDVEIPLSEVEGVSVG